MGDSYRECRGCCISLALIPLACLVVMVGVLLYLRSNAPDPPVTDEFRASQVEAEAFQNAVDTAGEIGIDPPRRYELEFNEREFSSWLTLESNEFAEDSDSSFPFSNIQVGLRDDQMTFYAEMDRYGLDLPIEVVVEPQTRRSSDTNSGEERQVLEFDIEEVHISGLSVPKAILNIVTDQVNDGLLEAFNDLGEYDVDEIYVGRNPDEDAADDDRYIFRMTGNIYASSVDSLDAGLDETLDR
ncbi:MAG: hypothetical protein GYB65_01400 [Chloroflexi bacterium]|nr:hypothetical protein [Chloroflexota bacterium]